MSEFTYTYSKSVDFGGQLAPGQFATEVANSSIGTNFLYVGTNGDVVNVVFSVSLTAPQQVTLDGLVAAHVPNPENVITTTDGYIELNSSLADSASIVINASNAAGGIDINAGTGGIAIDTTNGFNLTAGAAISISNTAGNITLDTPALIDLNAVSGINIGNDPDAAPVNIGTSSSVRTVSIGNTTGATAVTINSGTGNVNINSQDTIAIDAIGAYTVDAGGVLELNSDGGAISIGNDANNFGMNIGTAGSRVINIGNTTASSAVNIISGSWGATFGNDASGGEIQIAASANAKTVRVGNSTGGSALFLNAGTGAMTLDSVAAVEINSSAGQINIGNDADNQNINIGSGGSRVINIGNTNASSAVNILSGTWGATFGNDASSGEIQIAASANAKTVRVGNSTGGSRLFHSWGTGGSIIHQASPTSLSDNSQSLTIAQLLLDILTITPTTDRTLTLPTAALAVTGISGVAVDDAIDFRIINLATGASDPTITVAMDTGGTAVGYMDVPPHANNAGTYLYSGTGVFRLRFTNVTASSEAYTIYRIG